MSLPDDSHSPIKVAARLLVDRGVATVNTLCGCAPGEIAEVETEVGQPLPGAYRAFLARMGRGAGRFYVGSSIFYPGIVGLTAAARELVAEDKAGLALPDDAVPFLMHQGYEFLFLRAAEGDDPPVERYTEQHGRFERVADRFSQFLLDVACDAW